MVMYISAYASSVSPGGASGRYAPYTSGAVVLRDCTSTESRPLTAVHLLECEADARRLELLVTPRARTLGIRGGSRDGELAAVERTIGDASVPGREGYEKPQ